MWGLPQIGVPFLGSLKRILSYFGIYKGVVNIHVVVLNLPLQVLLHPSYVSLGEAWVYFGSCAGPRVTWQAQGISGPACRREHGH